jgi:hypothetical protein
LHSQYSKIGIYLHSQNNEIGICTASIARSLFAQPV